MACHSLIISMTFLVREKFDFTEMFRGINCYISDWKIRNLVRPINGPPSSWWKKESYEPNLLPRLGGSWHTGHLMPTCVAPSVLLTVSDRRAFIDTRKYLDRNASCLRDASDNYKVS